MGARPGGRAPDELRAVRFIRHFTRHAEGAVLVEFGNTRVLCTASVEETVTERRVAPRGAKSAPRSR